MRRLNATAANDALDAIIRYLERRPGDAAAQALHDDLLKARMRALHDDLLKARMRELIEGIEPGIPITPGPLVSSYIIEDRS